MKSQSKIRRKIYLSFDSLLYNSSFVCSLNLATLLAKTGILMLELQNVFPQGEGIQ